MIRQMLDSVYRLTEYLAAGQIFAIFAVILAQVLLALLGRVFGYAGIDLPTLAIPSYAEIAAYLLVTAAFFGMAGTLRADTHVRVTLFLERVPEGLARAMGVIAGLIGLLTSGFFGWRVAVMAHESWSFGDTSYGQLAIPLWIPQGAMLVGLLVLTISFADLVCTGRHDQTRE